MHVEEALSRRDDTVLLEALMELMLLSRSRVIVGQMLGNMPRLALQLRVRPPGISSYVSIDGNEWCTTTSCKSSYWAWGNSKTKDRPRDTEKHQSLRAG